MDECVYYTRDEVVVHDLEDDIWVSANGLVYDLTNLVQKRLETMTDCLRLLIQFAGKDLSWCFGTSGKPLERINQFGAKVPVFPPVMEKASEDSDYWWCDQSLVIGKITCLERRIRIINTLTRKVIYMNVCEEDSIYTIQQKYSERFNRNAGNYIWRKTGPSDENSGRLVMSKTLTQNGIIYCKNEMLGLPKALWLYFELNKN